MTSGWESLLGSSGSVGVALRGDAGNDAIPLVRGGRDLCQHGAEEVGTRPVVPQGAVRSHGGG